MQNFLSFFFCIFIGKTKNNNNFCTVFIFCKFSLDQIYSLAYEINLYRFTTMFIRHTCSFLSFFSWYYRTIFWYSFIFCKFSYLDQFYSFTRTILSYHFTTMFVDHTCKKFLSFFPLYFYRKNFSVRFLFSCKFSLDQIYSFHI